MDLFKTIYSDGNDRFQGAEFSTVHKRCLTHNGCIVDLGCLWWDWSSYFIGKKRIIGVDPYEDAIEGTEIFKGAISDYNGVANFGGKGIESNMFSGGSDVVKTLTWKDFCSMYNITDISVLKMNIEGSEYSIIKSFDKNDFSRIDQIAISFHDWLNPEWANDTAFCIEKIKAHGYEIIDLHQWGWKLCLKK
jgi:hypothetical protein